MKKFSFIISLLFSPILFIQAAHATCWVNSSSDRADVDYQGLRGLITSINDGDSPNCISGSGSSAIMAIKFTTHQYCTANRAACTSLGINGMTEQDGYSRVILGSPISLASGSMNVVVGNTPGMTASYGYPKIDARTHRLASVFTCSTSHTFTLKNLIIQTKDGLTRAGIQPSCVHFEDTVFVCSGDVHSTIAPGASGWCTGAGSGTVAPEDLDGDGYCAGTAPCVNPALTGPNDCDDDPTHPDAGSIHPNVDETCDGVDNNCDGHVDEGLTFQTYYRDNDRDGYGQNPPPPRTISFFGGTITFPDLSLSTFTTCAPSLSGYVTQSGDCDDTKINVHPDATEIPDNSTDEDCDGTAQRTSVTSPVDADSDGVTAAGDCDDNDPNRYPGLADSCADGVDQDCSGADSTVACATVFYDYDSDGYTTETDCDDEDASVHPGATEVCDGLDNNCDTITDPTELCGTPPPPPPPPPGTHEICNNTIDDEGDGLVDCHDTADCTACVDGNVDADGDGYSDNNGDCNDNNGAINPGVAEICGDAIDNDCDGAPPDEGCNGDVLVDDDGDGYCEGPLPCTDPSKQTGDCDDNSPSVHPGATEFCADSVDSNCNGMADDTAPLPTPTSGDGTIVPEVSSPTTGGITIDSGGPTCNPTLPPPGDKASGGCGCDLAAHQAPIGTLLALMFLGLCQPILLLATRRRHFL